MTIEVQLGSASDPAFVETFANLQRLARKAPYDRVIPEPSHWPKHLERAGDRGAFWLAHRDGRAVGRVGAVDPAKFPGMGYVGFFEVIDDDREAAASLLEAATGWLRARGLERALGPVDRNTWYAYRFWVDVDSDFPPNGNEEPYAWEPWTPPSYVGFFTAAGFTEAKRFHSLGYDSVPGLTMVEQDAIVRPALTRALAAGYRFEHFADDWEAVMRELFPLLTDVFAENFLFEEIGWEEYHELFSDIPKRADIRPSLWVYAPDGSKCGFEIAIVDRGGVGLKTSGLLPGHRGAGLSIAMVAFTSAWALANGYEKAIAPLFAAGGSSSRMRRSALDPALSWRHDYALFQLVL